MEKDFTNQYYTDGIKEKIISLGADLVGVSDVEPLKQLKLDPPELLGPFRRALSIAVKLPHVVFQQIHDRPTPLYAATYQTANRFLDDVAFHTARILQEHGFKSLPIPASQVLDEKTWHGAITHKAVARMAGLGWQGKSLLLINPEFGPRIRLVTVLTDAPLNTDSPIENKCGECTLCKDACPAGAIKGVSITDHYSNRNEALNLTRCAEKLTTEFSKLPHVGAPICGICIKVCPFGRKE